MLFCSVQHAVEQHLVCVRLAEAIGTCHRLRVWARFMRRAHCCAERLQHVRRIWLYAGRLPLQAWPARAGRIPVAWQGDWRAGPTRW